MQEADVRAQEEEEVHFRHLEKQKEKRMRSRGLDPLEISARKVTVQPSASKPGPSGTKPKRDPPAGKGLPSAHSRPGKRVSNAVTPEFRKHKRQRTDDEKEGEAAGGGLTAGVSYSDKLRHINLGIIPEDYPETLFTDDELETIDRYLLRQVRLTGEYGKSRPGFVFEFRGCSMETGYAVMTCANRETANWLRELKIKPWEGARIKVVEEADIPHKALAFGTFPKSDYLKTSEIVEILRVQNPEINLSKWKVVARRNQGGLVELSFRVDKTGEEYIRKKGFLRFHWGKAKMRLREKRKPDPEEKTDKAEAGGEDVVMTETPTAEAEGKAEAEEEEVDMTETLKAEAMATLRVVSNDDKREEPDKGSHDSESSLSSEDVIVVNRGEQ